MLDHHKIKNSLYECVNEEWLNNAIIAEDRPANSAFSELDSDIEKILMDSFEKMANGTLSIDNHHMEQCIAYYKKALDFDKRNEYSYQPIDNDLKTIEAMTSFADVEKVAIDWIKSSKPVFFDVSISPDMKNAQKYALYLEVMSLILPDKTYYDDSNPSKEHLLSAFSDMAFNLCRMVNVDEEKAHQLVKDYKSFDEKVSNYVMSAEQLADYPIIYNPRSMSEVDAYCSEFSLKRIIDGVLGKEIDQVIITQPTYFEAFNTLFTKDNFNEIKAWMYINLIRRAAPNLSEEMRVEAGKFRLVLSGADEMISPTKQAYYSATSVYSLPVGLYYSKNYFSEEAKKDVETIVREVIGVYKERLLNNDWLSKATIEKAIVKLDAIELLIGYPDTINSLYDELIVDKEKSYYENVVMMEEKLNADLFKRVDKKVDRTEWHMSSATVNAYYNPFANIICFPSGILQAPYYSTQQSTSANFGGIGAVIAHEISHAFDNNGSKFDEFGNLNDWWQEKDFKEFEQRAEKMVTLFDGVKTEVGEVNGRLTVSENIADLGGVACSLAALMKHDEYSLTDFFENWARVWRMKAKKEYMELLLNVDVHAPSSKRADVIVGNFDEFYTTYGVESTDAMYIAPEKRVCIW